MASSASSRATAALAALVLALLALAAAPGPANATSFTAYETMGCGGRSRTYNTCGCFNLNLFGGYDFKYSGLGAKLYCGYNCQCPYGATTLNADARTCAGNKFTRSFEIPCVEAAAEED